MALIDLIDETFIVCHPERVAAAVHEQRRWRQWWPDLDLVVFMDRGLEGIRWSVAGDPSGSLEIWLEPMGDGVLLHHYVRLDRRGADPSRPRDVRRGTRERRRRAHAWKRDVWALKDELEGDRPPGSGSDGRVGSPGSGSDGRMGTPGSGSDGRMGSPGSGSEGAGR